MSDKKKLIIGVDYDGTAMEFPEIYSALLIALRQAGHIIYLITGRSANTASEDAARLRCADISFDKHLNSELFNAEERQLCLWIDEKRISLDRDEVVCMWKARMIEQYDIDVLFDDAADKIRLYLAELPRKILLLKSPTAFNQVFAKWGRNTILEYSGQTESG